MAWHTPRLIVGFGHRSGHGKDTYANALQTAIATREKRLFIKKQPLAWELKMMTYRLYGHLGVKHPMHYENFREERKVIIPALGMTVVDLWIKFGTDAVRDQVYDRTWLEFTIYGHQNPVDLLIIPDVRFPNEADEINKNNGWVYEIMNPRVPKREGLSVDDELDGWKGFRGTFLNDADHAKIHAHCEMLADSVIRRLNGQVEETAQQS